MKKIEKMYYENLSDLTDMVVDHAVEECGFKIGYNIDKDEFDYIIYFNNTNFETPVVEIINFTDGELKNFGINEVDDDVWEQVFLALKNVKFCREEIAEKLENL